MRCVRTPLRLRLLLHFLREFSDRQSFYVRCNCIRTASTAFALYCTVPPPHSAPDVARTHCTHCNCIRTASVRTAFRTALQLHGGVRAHIPVGILRSLHARTFVATRCSAPARHPCLALMRAALGTTPLLAPQVRHIPDRASLRAVTAVLRSVSAHAFAPPMCSRALRTIVALLRRALLLYSSLGLRARRAASMRRVPLLCDAHSARTALPLPYPAAPPHSQRKKLCSHRRKRLTRRRQRRYTRLLARQIPGKLE